MSPYIGDLEARTDLEPRPDLEAWQESWDRQQEAYLPDREHRLSALLDTVEATAGTDHPRVLDLAGGTGSIALRLLARFPAAEVTLVDLDPVLLAIAGSSLRDRATVISADLREDTWTRQLPHLGFDAVLTATALHWFTPQRLAALYHELHDLLRPGGVFVNADHMPDPALPTLTKRLVARAEARRTTRCAAGAAQSWGDWWARAAADPVLAPLAERRQTIYPTGHSPEFTPAATWHVEALLTAGFSEAGVLWRGGQDAAVAGLR